MQSKVSERIFEGTEIYGLIYGDRFHLYVRILLRTSAEIKIRQITVIYSFNRIPRLFLEMLT